MTSKPSKVPQLNYFVSCVNTITGQAIIEEVRNDHLNDINPHIIVGTKSSKVVGPIPKSVSKIVNNSDPNQLAKTLLESDVIIYDLNSAPLDEVEFAIKVLKMSSYDSEKFLIIISSVMVWSATLQKDRRETEEDLSEIVDGETEPIHPEEIEDPEVRKRGTPYTEREYARRKPIPKYQPLKAIETQCLSAGASKPNLHSYVLCSGILYGHGEDVFLNYFRQAWLQEPDTLYYIGDGHNLIPTIHVKDLAMYVHFVVNKKPPTKYIFAIDHTKNYSLKSHVSAIADGVGTGKIESVQIKDMMHDPYLDVLRLDIKLKPSDVIEIVQNEEEEQEKSELTDGDIESIAMPKFKFVWWCKDGIRKNLRKVVDEFNTFRGLKPLKLFISGPPASGKSQLGASISKKYGLPHIVVADVVKEVKELPNEFGEEVRTVLAEIKKKMIEDEEKAIEEAKKKKKKGQPEPTFDPEKLVPRLPDPLLLKAYHYRLEKPDCHNRGFVLDGFPRTFDHAKDLFLLPAPVKEGETQVTETAEEQAPPKEVLNAEKVPEFVVRLEGSDEFLKARTKGLPEESIAGTHFTEEGMNRRLPIYNKINTSENGAPILWTFFENFDIEVLKLKVENVSEEELFETIKAYIEKKGSFSNFQDEQIKQEMRQKRRVREDQDQERKREEEIRREEEAREREEKSLQDEKTRINLEILKEQEKLLLDERSQPLRQYLADMVVPILTSGIIEVSRQRPEDPVDFLAEYLYKKSLEPKNTDTSNANIIPQ